MPAQNETPAPKKKTGWIGVDLDGTLAHYDPKTFRIAEVGEPIAPMVERVKLFLAQGWTVKIMTARAADISNHAIIHAWLLKQGLPVFEVTDRKDFDMVWLWDDRAIAVASNTGISHVDTHRLMWSDFNALARALGAASPDGESFHDAVLRVFDALVQLEAEADGALYMLTQIPADKFKGGDGSMAFKDLCAARLPLRNFVKRLAAFKKEKVPDAN